MAQILEVPRVTREGAVPASTHGSVVQTGLYLLGHPLVADLHPALSIVLAVLGLLFILRTLVLPSYYLLGTCPLPRRK